MEPAEQFVYKVAGFLIEGGREKQKIGRDLAVGILKLRLSSKGGKGDKRIGTI